MRLLVILYLSCLHENLSLLFLLPLLLKLVQLLEELELGAYVAALLIVAFLLPMGQYYHVIPATRTEQDMLSHIVDITQV